MLCKIQKLKDNISPRENLYYEPLIYHIDHVPLMTGFCFLFFFSIWPELVFKGKLEGTGFEQTFDYVVCRTRELLPEQA